MHTVADDVMLILQGYTKLFICRREVSFVRTYIIEVWVPGAMFVQIRITAEKKENQEIKPQEMEQKPRVISSGYY